MEEQMNWPANWPARNKVLTYEDIDDTPVNLELDDWAIRFAAIDNESLGEGHGYVFQSGTNRGHP